MADIEYTRGGIIAVTSSVQTVTIPQDDRAYSFFNAEGARVHFKLNSTTTLSSGAAGADQFFIDPGVSFTCPVGTTSLAIITAAGTATVMMSRGTFAMRPWQG